ncbi:MAG: hypothetical protein IT198_04320 [Acidimicrobiia bacterium]|nr:hypothetical protein [Acidimicrobiia bacterium]
MHRRPTLNLPRRHPLVVAGLVALLGHVVVVFVAGRAAWALVPGRDPVDVLVWVNSAAVGSATLVFFAAGRVAADAPGGTGRAVLVPAGVGIAPFLPGVIVHTLAYGRVAGMAPGLLAVTVLHLPAVTAGMWLGVHRARRDARSARPPRTPARS